MKKRMQIGWIRKLTTLVGLVGLLTASAMVEAKSADREAWYEFKFHGKKVGFLYSRDRTTQLGGRSVLHSTRRSTVLVRRQEHVIRMEATTDAWADPDGTPIKFVHSRVEAGEERKIVGRRHEGQLIVESTIGRTKTSKSHRLSKGVFLASTIDAVFKSDLSLGKTHKGRVIVEEDGEIRPFRMTVTKREGRLFVVESVVGEVASIERVDPSGVTESTRVERLGAEFIKVERSKALHLDRTEDIFSAARLATGVRLPPGESLDRLIVQIAGRSGRVPNLVTGGRQISKNVGDGVVQLTIRADRRPRARQLPFDLSDQLSRYVKKTPYEGVDDPKLVRAAKEVTEKATSAWDKAVAINRFVYTHIQNKSLARAFSTAEEAFSSREGDCTEHAVLFSALAKIVGIPTKLVTGLVYVGSKDGIFGYHQWVEVWMGEGWIPMDPTFGQDIADVTHIKFTEGLSDPEGLRKAGIAAAELFGDIRLEVVEYTTTDGKRKRI